jgi:hypothetical protein
MHIYTIIGSEIGYIGGNYKNDKPLLAANKAGKALFKKLEDVKYVKYKNKKSIKFVLKNKKDKKNYCYEILKKKNKKEFNYEIKECVLSKNQLKKYIGGVGSDSDVSSRSSSPSSPSLSSHSSGASLSRSPTPTPTPIIFVEPTEEQARTQYAATRYMQDQQYSTERPPPFPQDMLWIINRQQGLRWSPGHHTNGTWILTYPMVQNGQEQSIIWPTYRDDNNNFMSWNEIYMRNERNINQTGMIFNLELSSVGYDHFEYQSDANGNSDQSDQSDSGDNSSARSRESTPEILIEGGSIRLSSNKIKKPLNKKLLKIPKEIMW